MRGTISFFRSTKLKGRNQHEWGDLQFSGRDWQFDEPVGAISRGARCVHGAFGSPVPGGIDASSAEHRRGPGFLEDQWRSGCEGDLAGFPAEPGGSYLEGSGSRGCGVAVEGVVPVISATLREGSGRVERGHRSAPGFLLSAGIGNVAAGAQTGPCTPRALAEKNDE